MEWRTNAHYPDDRARRAHGHNR